jgi:hypothetical protein
MLIPDHIPTATEPEDMPPAEDMETSGGAYQLKTLKPKHKNILSLIAQGVDRETVAAACDITPGYVTMLCRMPICKQYIAGLNEACDLQLEAMYGKSVKVIDNAMSNGNIKEQLVGARLHLEATKRIGRPADVLPQHESTNDRLLRLAERLTSLIPQYKAPESINGSFTEVQPVSHNKESKRLADSSQAAERDGDWQGTAEPDEED